MGLGDMRACLEAGLEESSLARVVALADVDSHRLEHARKEVQKFYREKKNESAEVAVMNDFRELLTRDDIDGVLISTPDHWHGVMAVAAANAGKDMYVQKPLTYTIGEGKQLVKGVRRNEVVMQTGSQQRSDRRFRRACELVRNGFIGKLHTIRVMLPPDSGVGRSTPMEVPANLDFDLWLGPTPLAEYTEDRVHPQSDFKRPGWLQIEPYCRGMITGWGSHMFDIAQWGHGSDDTGPVEFEATGEFPERGLFNVHTTFKSEARYADGVRLLAETGTPAGVVFEGDEGSISVGRGHLTATPEEILHQGTGDDLPIKLYRSDNHMKNFLECMRSRRDPICSVEVGHHSNNICVATHIAMRLGTRLRWDPVAERFLDNDQANALLDYEHRKPWTIEENS